MDASKRFWETLEQQHEIFRAQIKLQRARVPGGWLIRYEFMAGSEKSAADMCFVPDPDHLWRQEEMQWEKLHHRKGVNTAHRTCRLNTGAGWLYMDWHYAISRRREDGGKDGHLSVSVVYVDEGHISVPF